MRRGRKKNEKRRSQLLRKACGGEGGKAIVLGPGGGAISSLPSERNGFKLLPCFRGFVSGAGRQTTRSLQHVHPGTRNTKKLPS